MATETAQASEQRRPASPAPRRGIRIRIYALSAEGIRTDLPMATEASRPGPCGVPGCTCLGNRR